MHEHEYRLKPPNLKTEVSFRFIYWHNEFVLFNAHILARCFSKLNLSRNMRFTNNVVHKLKARHVDYLHPNLFGPILG